MGLNTVNFSCHHCNHCCTEVICLPTPWDVIRIVKGTGQAPLDFLEFITPDDIQGVNKNDPTWLHVDGEKYMMALKRHGQRCHFLDKKTRYCSIYEHRPLLCRLYPFRLKETRTGEYNGFTLHNGIGCPKHRDGVYQTAPLYEIYKEDKVHHDDYDTLVDVFNKKDYPGKKPEDFLDMFITIKRKKKAAN